MKKLFLYIFLVLMWCNAGFAEVIEFRKCFYAKSSTYVPSAQKKFGSSSKSWNDFNKRHKIKDNIFTINSDLNTITRTSIRTDAGVEIPDDYIDDVNMSQFPKVSQTVFEITTYTSDLITGKVAEESIVDENAFSISTIYFDISEASADMEQINYSKTTNKKTSITNVKIKCEETLDAIADGDKSGSSGTAFFINNRGNLLTNNHVVDGCIQSKINYFDKEYDAQLIATDKNLDLALLKVDLEPKSYLNFSANMPKKLQKIYVAGYPFGKGLSDDLKISSGIVSSLKGLEDNSNEIQVDAPINYGNSGGPIVGVKGELVAIAVSGLAKEITEGINFGIKSSAAANFLSVNEIQPIISKNNSINNDQLLKILEGSTVYTYCDLKK